VVNVEKTKSTFEKELKKHEIRDRGFDNIIYRHPDVLSAKNKAKKEILKEIEKEGNSPNRILPELRKTKMISKAKAKKIIEEKL